MPNRLRNILKFIVKNILFVIIPKQLPYDRTVFHSERPGILPPFHRKSSTWAESNLGLVQFLKRSQNLHHHVTFSIPGFWFSKYYFLKNLSRPFIFIEIGTLFLFFKKDLKINSTHEYFMKSSFIFNTSIFDWKGGSLSLIGWEMTLTLYLESGDRPVSFRPWHRGSNKMLDGTPLTRS